MEYLAGATYLIYYILLVSINVLSTLMTFLLLMRVRDKQPHIDNISFILHPRICMYVVYLISFYAK